jgi:hypothetical protein
VVLPEEEVEEQEALVVAQVNLLISVNGLSRCNG